MTVTAEAAVPRTAAEHKAEAERLGALARQVIKSADLVRGYVLKDHAKDTTAGRDAQVAWLDEHSVARNLIALAQLHATLATLG